MESNQQKPAKEIAILDIIEKLEEFFRVLMDHKKVVIIFSCAVGLSFGLMKFFSDPEYVAKTTLTLEDTKSSPFSSITGFAGMLGFGGGLLAGGEEKFIETLKSRNILARALLEPADLVESKPLLVNYYIEIYDLWDNWDDDPRLAEFTFTHNKPEELSFLEDSLMNKFHQQIMNNMVTVQNAAGVLTLNVNTRSELLSKQLSEELIEAASNFYVNNNTTKEKSTVAVIQDRADSIKIALKLTEDRLAKWMDSSKRLIKAEGYLEEFRLKRELELLNILYGEVTKNLELAKFNLLHETPVVQIIDKPVLPIEKARKGTIVSTILGGIIGGFLICMFYIVRHIYISARAERKVAAA